MSETPMMDALKHEVSRLYGLLDDPHPESQMWHIYVSERWQAIADLRKSSAANREFQSEDRVVWLDDPSLTWELHSRNGNDWATNRAWKLLGSTTPTLGK